MAVAFGFDDDNNEEIEHEDDGVKREKRKEEKETRIMERNEDECGNISYDFCYYFSFTLQILFLQPEPPIP